MILTLVVLAHFGHAASAPNGGWEAPYSWEARAHGKVYFLPFAWAFKERMFYVLGGALMLFGSIGLLVGTETSVDERRHSCAQSATPSLDQQACFPATLWGHTSHCSIGAQPGRRPPMIPDRPATSEEIRQHLDSEDWVWLEDAYQRGTLTRVKHDVGSREYRQLGAAIGTRDLLSTQEILDTQDTVTTVPSRYVEPPPPKRRWISENAIAVGAVSVVAAVAIVGFAALRHGNDVAPLTTPDFTVSKAALPGIPPVVGDAITVASQSSTFAPFLELVESAGLTEEMRTASPLTVFIPTESAIANLPADVRIALRATGNHELLIRIVRFHMVGQSIRPQQLATGELTTLAGDRIALHRVPSGALDIGGAAPSAEVRASNANLIAIDHLLLPPGVTFDIIVNPNS